MYQCATGRETLVAGAKSISRSDPAYIDPGAVTGNTGSAACAVIHTAPINVTQNSRGEISMVVAKALAMLIVRIGKVY
jgi:hypothetical protein